MECFAELLPPTAVTHAIALPFLSPNANNVVIAKTSLLQVFDIKPSPATDDASGEQQTARLVLVGEYPLSGTVTALARVKILDTKTGGEAILLSFAHAKLSLLEWDPDNHRTSTISIHFYEGDNIVDQPFGPGLSECDTILTADPSSRCAALKFGPRFLAIVPFRQAGDELIGEEEEGADANAITKTSIAQTNGGLDVAETPYKPSFVLPMTTLDPSLNCIVHLAFLHEYREPTFGILASSTLPSAALLAERKDILTYTVFTLDLEQRASTNLITVTKLPSSLWKVMPLPAPIGGALLIGDNEIIHIDQSGKANATAVNEFAKLESDFGMADQSHLNMKLEGCVVEVIDHMSGGLLIVLRDGSMATLSFKVLRRSISELVVTRLASEMSGAISRASPSCLTLLRDGTIFVGSDFGPSSLVSCYATTVPSSRKRSLAQMNEKADEAVNREGSEADEEEAEEEEDDDDLYSVAPATKKRATSSNVHSNIPDIANFTFAPLDNLPSLAPVNQVCLGRAKGSRAGRLELLAGTGRGHSSRLAILNRDIIPEALGTTSIGSASAAWTVCAKPEKHADQAEQKSIDRAFDNLLFVNDDSTTRILDINDSDDNESQFVERSAPEFENEGETLEVSTLRNGTRIVQCRKNDIRIYESNLALSQIIPMEDEESGAELNIVHTSTCEPYLLVVLDDGSMQVHQVQGKEVEPLTCHGVTEEKKWLSGSIYSGSLTRDDPVLLLLSSNGSLHMFSLPDLEPIGTVLSLPHLPPVFSMESSQRRMGAKETLTELLMADLGADGHSQPYLVLRTAMDDIVLYEPFNDRKLAASSPWYADLRFRKVPMVYIPKYNEAADDDLELKPPALRGVNIGQYQAICIPGTPPSLILRSASSSPKVLEIRSTDEHGHVQRISSLNTPRCQQGFLTVDSGGTLKEFRLPEGAWFSSGWSVRQLDLGGELRHLAYHTSREVYVVATSRDVDFYFSEDDNRHPEQDDISSRPQVPQYSIHLVSSATRRVIDTYDMPSFQCITSLKIMPLEISENTHEQKSMIVVGSAALRGEDMPARGLVTVLDIIDVVPDPDSEESGVKFSVVSNEETKGAVTAIESFPGGLIGTAQGQKLMIRGLKEDGSCLPVAFLDAQCHATTLKSLHGRGLWLLGDAWKGLWFGGFTEEPYKITVLGKSTMDVEVICAEFLPFEGQLYILVVDSNTDLHILQYDPENPKTVSGMRLLHRSSFHVGHFPTSMTLLPSTLSPFTDQEETVANGHTSSADHAPPLFHILLTSASGALDLITALDESTYRRLSALQIHLTAILEHAAGLNPRAYRACVEGEGFGGRGVVDGNLVRRIFELGTAKRSDVLGRAAGDAWRLRSDLEIIGGGGLAYL